MSNNFYRTSSSAQVLVIYRGPGFLATNISPVDKLSLFLSLPVCRRSRLLTGVGVRGGERGAKSYDGKKTCSSINHLILSCEWWEIKKNRRGAKSYDGKKTCSSINHLILSGTRDENYRTIGVCLSNTVCTCQEGYTGYRCQHRYNLLGLNVIN